MSKVVLSLGGVAFRDMEVPEQIRFGGRQRVAVQALIGGGRSVSALGIDDGLIEFSGIFSGNDAVGRAQMLDAARALGAALPLVWDGFYYSVVIETFAASYRKHNLIPFAITCVVVSDPVAALAALATPIANLISLDLAAASVLGGQAGYALAVTGTASAAELAAAQSGVQAALGAGGAVLNGAVALVNGATDAGAGAAAVGQLGDAASQHAALAGMAGYVGRAVSNFAGEFL
jgi:hypothetical protein